MTDVALMTPLADAMADGAAAVERVLDSIERALAIDPQIEACEARCAKRHEEPAALVADPRGQHPIHQRQTASLPPLRNGVQ